MGETRPAPAARPRRRPAGRERSLAGAPMAGSCRERGGAQRGWETGPQRSQVPEPAGLQEPSRRPEPPPTQTPEALAAARVRRRQTCAPDGSGTVSAGVLRDPLRHRRGAARPSRRPLARLRHRQAKEVHSPAVPSAVASGLSPLGRGKRATGLERIGIRTGGRALEPRGLGAQEAARRLWAM
jgi:hypothetical protein